MKEKQEKNQINLENGEQISNPRKYKQEKNSSNEKMFAGGGTDF